jgi:hypothetical protein
VNWRIPVLVMPAGVYTGPRNGLVENKFRFFKHSRKQVLLILAELASFKHGCRRSISILRAFLLMFVPNSCDTHNPVSRSDCKSVANTASRQMLQLTVSCFNIGILMPFSLAILRAFSYPASACLTIAIPGSVVKTVINFFSVSLVPSATKHIPACML